MTLSGLFLTMTCFTALGSEVAKYGAKLGTWSMDYQASIALAREKKLPMLLKFTGSDWCGWCKLMEENVLSKPAWLNYASQNLVLVTLDFPKDKSIVPAAFTKSNEALQSRFSIKSYPTYVLVESDGISEIDRLFVASEDASPANFIKAVADALRFHPANINAKVAELGERGPAYREAIAKHRKIESEFMDWLDSNPNKSPQNEKIFESFQARLEESAKAIESF